tara:strand:- start:1995 stop:2534 length:540 start_codon:yes stop_codon:yes gene_type:complete
MSSPKYYTGVGIEDLPSDMKSEIAAIARRMSIDQYVVRSGGAAGTDTVFQSNAGPNTEVYLPYDGYNDMTEKDGAHLNSKGLYNHDKAAYIASINCKEWDTLTQDEKDLHTRSVYSVLGFSLDNPSLVLICYAEPSGISLVKGEYSTAVSVAHGHRIPVYNLWRIKDLNEIKRIVGIYD